MLAKIGALASVKMAFAPRRGPTSAAQSETRILAQGAHGLAQIARETA
jgi:hypothetical protein